MRELYGYLRLYVNFFQPQMRLVSKTRHGARLTKHYDKARTPYRRILENPEVCSEAKEALTQTYLALDPAELKRAIGRCQERLIRLSATKQTPEGGAPLSRSPLQEHVLLAAGFEDIFDEATGGRFEDILR